MSTVVVVDGVNGDGYTLRLYQGGINGAEFRFMSYSEDISSYISSGTIRFNARLERNPSDFSRLNAEIPGCGSYDLLPQLAWGSWVSVSIPVSAVSGGCRKVNNPLFISVSISAFPTMGDVLIINDVRWEP